LFLTFCVNEDTKVKTIIELIQGNQALQEQNKELERKVICLERRILPQMEGHLRSLEERLAHLENEGSHHSSQGSLSGLSGLSRSGQRARRTGGLPRIPDENHHLVARVVTPFPSVRRITIVDGVRHSILSGGHLVEIKSSDEEEAEASSSSYRSVPLAPVHNDLPSSRPPSYIE
jgi:hypothetical protein